MSKDRRTSVDAVQAAAAMAHSPTMHRHTASDTGDMFSRRSSRALSFSSDRPSVASSVTFQMPTTVRPLPAYIAASVASQMVTDNHNAQLRHADSEHEELENAIFSDQALSLLNGFLDHLLFAFLSTARSPSLAATRPAMSEVLKPRLAREAAEAADEELQGLLSGEDDDESFPIDSDRAIDRWDVEKVWKRTRLRIMVYTRLGEMEDEDEERYVQQERGLSMDEDGDEEAGLVSWASAIFLTSVVEYIAEQTLLIAGQAAYARMASRSKKSQHDQDADDLALERLVIEEPDVEKIALNSALGRLWRTWRKRVRSSVLPLSPNRGIRPNSSYASLHGRRGSQAAADDSYYVEPTPISDRAPSETDIAANIPLPITARDIDEIEVPGLARTYENAESSGTQTPVSSRPQRPSSVIVLASAENFRRRHNVERPTSMPGPEALPLVVPSRSRMDEKEEGEENQLETPFETPMTSTFDRSPYIGDQNRIEPSLLLHKGEGNAHDAMLAAALATSPKDDQDQSGVEPDTPTSVMTTSSDTYDVEPKVLQSKRMSIGKSGPPGIVRTFSTRSSSLKSPRETPTATPTAPTHAEARSYLDDHSEGEEIEGPQAIGVARTSDVPIRSSPTPSVEPWTERAKVVSAQGGYVEVQPTPRSVPLRNTPTPDSKPIIPERSVARNDVLKRAGPNVGSAGLATLAGTASPPRRRDATPPTSGRTSLPSLQEVEYCKPQQTVASEQTMRRNSPTFSNRSRTQSPHLARDVAVAMAGQQGSRHSTEETLRSPSAAAGSIVEKPGVKRVGSTSSKKSGSISRLPNPRDSDPQLSRNLSGRMSEEDIERQFEELVQGKETVKYTLTPENMRALDESPAAVRKAEPERPSNPSVTVYPRDDAHKDHAFGANALPTKSTSKGRVPGAPHHKPSPSRKVITRPLAREPRVESESMRDFADFIRSTGPSPGQEKAVQPFVNISGNGLKSADGSSASIGRKSSTKHLSSRNLDGPTARPRVNMEPRSPAGLSTGNDDLIDFIRQGPPNGPEGQPRIPRSVAPFRSTVDSDQFETMLGDHGNVESAYGSKASTLDSQHSIQTSNSKTGLIAPPNVVQPAYSNTPQKLSGSMTSSSEPVITRTRRRIKDPYAIDFSDEDDEDEDQLTALPASNKPPAPRQESLMDFLNEMEPPSAPSASKPQPFMLSQETIAAAKARANSSTSSVSSSATATRSNGGSNGAAPPMGFPSSSGAETTRAHKPRVAARAPVVGDVRANRSTTSELADFLRNSGPPEPVGPPPGARKEEEKKKSSNMKFWRKNKEKTYGDLP
ncbi:D-lactate dehydrogenase (cytochrome) [Ascochyta rabiei]|uniref:D-lactate dehydrogenase (cytochrome) n=1 Tax=Didymella rabiei TaxID=5454 RepID=UPI00220B9C76|nr:D-lactate dehydrogenase (cytochrome) [Ascochyta rabiei]UPX15235.1 D-lactate dehydrogenase (cytochrome) [Ascochyta rabiei]